MKFLKFIFIRESRIRGYLYLIYKNTWLKKFARLKLKKYNIYIGKNVQFNGKIQMHHPLNLVIGDRVILGKNILIYQNVTIGQKNNKYPIIGDNVIIYPNSVIIGDITIGNNAVIGAGSVVINSVPENAVVAGNPAKIIK